MRSPDGGAAGDAERLASLGASLARVRLDQNRTQSTLAAEAGVSVSTVKRLEAGGSTQLTNLIRVLRALGLLANLAALAPEPGLRPLAALAAFEQRGARGPGPRRRASSPGASAPSAEPPAAGEWSWGDER